MGNMNYNDYYRKKVQIFNYVGSEMVINLRKKRSNERIKIAGKFWQVTWGINRSF
jgi:hypothetical protein